MIPADLPPAWRSLAETFREHAAEPLALAYERCADQLDVALARADEEALTLQEAAALGGYSVDHVGRQIRSGHIKNAGRHGAPRIRRRDVPIKAGHVPVAPRTSPAHTSPTQIVRSVVDPRD